MTHFSGGQLSWRRRRRLRESREDKQERSQSLSDVLPEIEDPERRATAGRLIEEAVDYSVGTVSASFGVESHRRKDRVILNRQDRFTDEREPVAAFELEPLREGRFERLEDDL